MTSSDPPTEDRLPPEATADRAAADAAGRETPAADEAPLPGGGSHEPPYTHTRLSGNWASIVVGLLVLLVLIIFILENTGKTEVSFFGAHAHLSLGIALLLAAVIGGLVVVFAGSARILQLRTRARRTARSAGHPKRRHK
jgi:uncharacterized integral membrane protein